MGLLKNAETRLYNLLRLYRWRAVNKLLDTNSQTLLDIGCEGMFFHDKLKDRYKVTVSDYCPKNSAIKKEDIQNLSFEDKSFDIILCQQVLEHVPDPPKAILELKRVAKKQLIISVPYEPFFTFFRLLIWEKEHLWAITPKILKFYLGEPAYEHKIFLKTYYLAVWRFD
ncbi:MAG: class I SAM-dependent methyltransferase [Candidatus Omnitrophica bacterium]|jgi:ubiquinone/menaquinone biosynthesis C-methylase UbiE|nr:class I SAM-dependent methyltransferase [Candidatus Omnitrophota bacterium]